MAIASINPANGETLKTFQPFGPQALEASLSQAAKASLTWRRSPLEERAACMVRAAEILEAEKRTLARIMTLEMGKPLQAAVDEAAKCATACRYYVEHAGRILADRPVSTGAQRSFVRRQPLGVVLAVMPWNFPFWQVFRFAAPALMAGNVGLLKHASNVPQCALAIQDIFDRAGFPKGVFQTLLIGAGDVGRVIEDHRVAAVTLTGSEAAGVQVAACAGRLIKKTVLELGGSDPFVVLPSADLEAAVSTAVKARVINNGQSCIAAKRFIVAESVYAEFELRFCAAMRGLVVGDPLDENTQVGPLATPQIAADLEHQVQRARQAGAKVLCGGSRIAGAGNYFEPTVIAGLPRDAEVYREEFFGPVALLFRARGIAEAIDIANDTPFGLGASAWTEDPVEQERLINEIESGMVFINGMVASDARLPFGGIKRSGYGRELAEEGLLEFVNTKTVWIGASRARTE